MADETNKREQSEYNMAVSYLNRLNSLFYVANEAAIELDANIWFHALSALARELSTEMNEEEINEWFGTDDKQGKMDMINYILSIETNNPMNRGMGISPALYKSLSDFERFLRQILKASGLQNRMMEDAHKALK